MPVRAIWSPPSAVIATGMACAVSLRRCAVTMMSPALACVASGAAGAVVWACAAPGKASAMASEGCLRRVSQSVA
jgi:hypothetical protein